MKHSMRAVLVVGGLALGCVGHSGAENRPVVLELFTSEGCSSCPPAEAIVNELAQRRDVLPLAFHVDYWDELGWKDRHSMAGATQRQNRYARRFRMASVYTPQAVVDGSRELVGSRRGAVMEALSARRDGVPTSAAVMDGAIHITVGVGSAAVADVLLISYLHEATSVIGRGENSGRTLKESNIVLSMHRLGEWDGAPRDFQVALSDLPEDATDFAVLVQGVDQGAMLGAIARSIR